MSLEFSKILEISYKIEMYYILEKIRYNTPRTNRT